VCDEQCGRSKLAENGTIFGSFLLVVQNHGLDRDKLGSGPATALIRLWLRQEQTTLERNH
jgi:hypothetical protein